MYVCVHTRACMCEREREGGSKPDHEDNAAAACLQCWSFGVIPVISIFGKFLYSQYKSAPACLCKCVCSDQIHSRWMCGVYKCRLQTHIFGHVFVIISAEWTLTDTDVFFLRPITMIHCPDSLRSASLQRAASEYKVRSSTSQETSHPAAALLLFSFFSRKITQDVLFCL